MIFQEPMTSLESGRARSEAQIVEAIRLHEKVSKKRGSARERVRGLFGEVGIPDPEQRLDATTPMSFRAG